MADMPQNGPSNAEAAENSDRSLAAATQSRTQGRFTPHHGDEETDSQHLPASSAQYENGAHLFLHSSYKSGQRIRLEYKGRADAGTVDTATDDDSVVWVWLDGGAGRVMLFPGAETVITKEVPVAAKGESGALNGTVPCWCYAASGIYKVLFLTPPDPPQ